MTHQPGPRLLIVEPQFVARRTIALSAAKLGLGKVDEATSLGMAKEKLLGRRYNTVVLALDAGPPAEVKLLLAACKPARVIGVSDPGHAAAAEWMVGEGLTDILDRPARVKEMLRMVSTPRTMASATPEAVG